MKITTVAELGNGVKISGDHSGVSLVVGAIENGRVVIENDDNTRRSVSEKWWENETYLSNSHQTELKVTDMESNHIANAIVKAVRDATMFFEGGGKLSRDLLNEMLDDAEVRSLLSEYIQRYEEQGSRP